MTIWSTEGCKPWFRHKKQCTSACKFCT